jgi:hypothetical protein
VNGPIYQAVVQLHSWIGLDVSDPAITMDEYRVKQYRQEDRAGNPVQFLLIPISLGLLVWTWKLNRKTGQNLVFAGCLLASFILFCLAYKWQSTGSRLQLPFFVAWSPLYGLALDRVNLRWWRWGFVLLLAVLAIPFILSNPSRALVQQVEGDASLMEEDRSNLLFANQPEVKQNYFKIVEFTRDSKCQKVGLYLDSSDPEYVYWALLDPTGKIFRIGILDGSPELARFSSGDFKPCAIICSICDQTELLGLVRTESAGNLSLYLPANR